MIAAVSERAAELGQLCELFRVQRLDLIGLAASGRRREGAQRSGLSGRVPAVARGGACQGDCI